MKVSITLSVSDDDRRAIAGYYGEEGKAPYPMVRDFLQSAAETTLESIAFDDGVAQPSEEG